jgi:hypothetical protein
MVTPAPTADERRILEIIQGMFDAISWTAEAGPDLDRFAAAVRKDAVVVPSARPASPTSIEAFAARMGSLHASRAMTNFVEEPTGTVIKVFGNIAVAIGGFTALADGATSRGANAFLFVRDDGDWRIAGMAWDNEGPDKPLPEELA